MSMKPVPAPDKDPSTAYPVAPDEARTRPFGALGEGDTALIEAAGQLPVAEHIVPTEDGKGSLRVVKQDTPGQTMAIVEKTGADGTVTRSNTRINKLGMSTAPAVSAYTFERPSGGQRSEITVAMDNQVGSGARPRDIELEHDPQRAQAVKVEIAGKFAEASRHLGETGIKAA